MRLWEKAPAVQPRGRSCVKLLENKVAIVTGAGQGIGRALAKGLAAEGAKVVVAELHGENGARVAKDIEAAGGIALAVRTDVSSEASVNAMIAAAFEAFHTIDVLVNNAAIFPASSVAEMKNEEWEQVLRTNLTGAFFCARAVMPAMKKSGGGGSFNFTLGRALPGGEQSAQSAASTAGTIGVTQTTPLAPSPLGAFV